MGQIYRVGVSWYVRTANVAQWIDGRAVRNDRHFSSRAQARAFVKQKETLYMIVRVNDRSNKRIDMLSYPVSHDDACVILKKMTIQARHKHLRNVLCEVLDKALSVKQ